MQYRLRTLIVVLTIGPPLLAATWLFLPESLALAMLAWVLTGLVWFAISWGRVVARAKEARMRVTSHKRHLTDGPAST